MQLLDKRGTYLAKDSAKLQASRYPLRSVSYLKHTNENWIRYRLNDGRDVNVLVNIYDVQSIIMQIYIVT